MITNSKTLRFFLTLIVCMIFFHSCDDIGPITQVRQERQIRVLSGIDVEDVKNTLLKKLYLENSETRFSVNNGHNAYDFDIDWGEVLELIDTLGARTYTFRVKDYEKDPYSFYNLYMKYDQTGNVHEPYLLKYEMSEDFKLEYEQTLSLDNFSGTIVKYFLNRDSFNAGSSANLEVNDIRSNTAEPCPDGTTVENGNASGGGNGGPTNFPNNNNTTITVTTSSSYYCELTWWKIEDGETVQVTGDADIEDNVDVYYIVTQQCWGIPPDQTELAGENCDLSDEILIIPPERIEDQIDYTQLDSCVSAVMDDVRTLQEGMTWIIAMLEANAQPAAGFLSLAFEKYNWTVLSGNNSANYNGSTLPAFNGNNQFEKVVTVIDSDKLKDATDLSIARTILHESIHAYLIARYIETSNDNYTLFELSYPQLLLDYANGIDSNTAQHGAIVRNFLKPMADALEEYGLKRGYNLNRAFYDDLVWGGLIVDDSETYYPWFPLVFTTVEERERVRNVVNVELTGKDIHGSPKQQKGQKAGC